MTTTELISLLKSVERGGVTGRSREVYLIINGNKYLSDLKAKISSTGDGLITDVWIDVECEVNDYE